MATLLTNEHWAAMRAKEYPVDAPPLVIEVFSPSNTTEEMNRQRVAAFSGGTKEFRRAPRAKKLT